MSAAALLALVAVGTKVGPLTSRTQSRPAPAGPTRSPRAVLLFSPNAGTSRRLPRARATLAELGVEVVEEVDVREHRRLEDRVRVWNREFPDEPLLIIAAGGDGTVGTAAGCAIETGAVLGVLPLGTSNDFARSLGIPTDPAGAAELIVSGEPAAVDVGCFVPDAGGVPRYFVHAATVGVNVNFAKLATQESLRRRLGRLTYLAAGARALRGHRGVDCRLEWLGQGGRSGRVEHWRLVQLSVINAPVFGGFLNLRIPRARVDDGTLNIVAVERLSWRALLGIAAQFVLGTHRPVPEAHTDHVRTTLRVVPADQQPVEVALDGEPTGMLPGEFHIVRHGMRVIVPAPTG